MPNLYAQRSSNMLSYHAEGDNDVSLKDVLAFFTGIDREPPTGFPDVPQLEFLHGSGFHHSLYMLFMP